MMSEVLLWLFLIEIIGTIAFIVNFRLFGTLPDRGYSVSKILGLLMVAFPVWILASVGTIPSTNMVLSIWVIFLSVVALVVAYVQRDSFRKFLKSDKQAIFIIEGIFLLTFALWVLIKIYDPDINNTEQPMDFAFLNASIKAEYFPPRDPWLSGHTISYYYFGYLILGNIAELAMVPSRIAYNLAISSIPALSAGACFGLLYNLLRFGNLSYLQSVVGSMLGPIVLLVSSNLFGLLELVRLRKLAPDSFWSWLAIKYSENNGQWDILTNPEQTSWIPTDYLWWWRSTRVVDTLSTTGESLDYTITEFPWFSLLIGDLHPHVMAIPFVLLFLTFAFNYFISPYKDRLRLNMLSIWTIVVGATVLGAVGFINTWDIVPLVFIWLIICVVKAGLDNKWDAVGIFRHLIFSLGIIVPLSIAIYIPYYIDMDSQASGVVPVGEHGTRLIHLIIIFGMFLWCLLPIIMRELSGFVSSYLKYRECLNCGANNNLFAYKCSVCTSETYVFNMWLLLIGAIVLVLIPFSLWAMWHILVISIGFGSDSGDFVFGRFMDLLPVMFFQIIIMLGIFRHSIDYSGHSKSLLFVLSLLACAGFLVIGSDLFRIEDLFQNRMNTVFKSYYHAWILLSVAASFGLTIGFSTTGLARNAFTIFTKRIWILTVIALISGSLYYPVIATNSKVNFGHVAPSLDGLAYLKQQSPGTYDAIIWLDENLTYGDIVLEAVGQAYIPEASRYSGSTGFSTVLGWPGHQHQWRGSTEPYAGRSADISEIYTTNSDEIVRELTDKYDIDYIIVGPREIYSYGSIDTSIINQIGDLVFKNNDVSIYEFDNQ